MLFNDIFNTMSRVHCIKFLHKSTHQIVNTDIHSYFHTPTFLFYFKNVEIGGIVYTIKPPTIKVICRAIHHFSNNTSSLKKTRKEYL